MGIFNKLKRLMAPKEETSQETERTKNIYEELGIVEPFTVLAGKQFNTFIAELANNKSALLNKTEVEAFDELWMATGIDMLGKENNIPNLKNGTFEIFCKDDITLSYEKRSTGVKSKYSEDNGRATFVYVSKDGNFVINQSDRNVKVFLVYVSNGISDRLLRALSEAEIEALELDQESIQMKNPTGIPENLDSKATKIEQSEKLCIRDKYKVDVIPSNNIDSSVSPSIDEEREI